MDGELVLSPFPSAYALEIIDENTLKIRWFDEDSKSSLWDVEKTYNYGFEYENGMLFIVLDEELPQTIELGVYATRPQKYGNKIMLLIGQEVPAEGGNGWTGACRKNSLWLYPNTERLWVLCFFIRHEGLRRHK